MLSKITLILPYNITLYLSYFCIIFIQAKCIYNCWHAACIIIIFQPEQIFIRKIVN